MHGDERTAQQLAELKALGSDPTPEPALPPAPVEPIEPIGKLIRRAVDDLIRVLLIVVLGLWIYDRVRLEIALNELKNSPATQRLLDADDRVSAAGVSSSARR